MRLISKDDKQWLMQFDNWLIFSLQVSYLLARKGGKRGTFDEHKFETYEFLNLIKLRNMIVEKTYIPLRGTAHIIHNPVIREIFAAAFRDRVLHHLLYITVYDWWERHFILDSYSCREGKGTSYGVERLKRQIQAASDNYRKKVYVIKLDIQGYFMSLPRKKLYERAMWGLDRQFEGNYGKEYELMRFLWKQIIFDDPCRKVKRKGWPKAWRDLPPTKSLFKQLKGIGIVIGNLTSQLLSNIYLDQLDRYVIFDLGHKYYGRYVDDFYFVVTEDELPQARKDIQRIANFLKRLGLRLHPKKQYIQAADKGVAFLGAVVYPGRVHPGKRLKKNMRKAFREVQMGEKDVDTVVSYMGHVKYMKSRKFLTKMFAEVGWEYNY